MFNPLILKNYFSNVFEICVWRMQYAKRVSQMHLRREIQKILGIILRLGFFFYNYHTLIFRIFETHLLYAFLKGCPNL